MPRKLMIFAGLVSVTSLAAAAIVLASAPRGRLFVLWRSALGSALAQASNAAPPLAPRWAAAAPGLVEPRSGLIRLTTGIAGRVAAVAVKPDQHVEKDQVLLRLEDMEARARLAAAVAEAEASRRERGAHPVTAGRETVNKAEDAVFDAERVRASARLKLDEAIADSGAPGESAQSLAASRQEFADATDRLAKAKAALAAAQAKSDVPAPSRLEAEVIADRAKVTAAEQLFDETRMRAPAAGTVLQVNARAGELVARGADTPLVVMGDTSLMRVRAEVDERDIAKIKVSQEAVIRDEAYPGVDFHGRVTEIAPVIGVPHLSSRNVHRLPDVDVVQVLIDLNGTVALLPGMQTDVFFKSYPEQEAPKAPGA